jgi:hypothetical protein
MLVIVASACAESQLADMYAEFEGTANIDGQIRWALHKIIERHVSV